MFEDLEQGREPLQPAGGGELGGRELEPDRAARQRVLELRRAGGRRPGAERRRQLERGVEPGGRELRVEPERRRGRHADEVEVVGAGGPTLHVVRRGIDLVGALREVQRPSLHAR